MPEKKQTREEEEQENFRMFGSILVGKNQGRHGRSGAPEGYVSNSGCGGFD